MRDLAMHILEHCGGDRDIIRQVQSLMNSAEDTVPKEEALGKLRALRTACLPRKPAEINLKADMPDDSAPDAPAAQPLWPH